MPALRKSVRHRVPNIGCMQIGTCCKGQLIYTTGLPPGVASSAMAGAYRYMEQHGKERTALRSKMDLLIRSYSTQRSRACAENITKHQSLLCSGPRCRPVIVHVPASADSLTQEGVAIATYQRSIQSHAKLSSQALLVTFRTTQESLA